MRVIKLKGGLGNQMFQYAFAKLIERTTNDEVKIDYSAYNSLNGDEVRVPRLKLFSISLPEVTEEELQNICFFPHKGNSQTFMYRVGIYIEKTFNSSYLWESTRMPIDIKKLTGYTYFDGYWQSFSYVDQVFDLLKKEYVPNAPLSTNTLLTKASMEKCNSVFIGIRKGDYSAEIKHYGVFDDSYYISAMKQIEKTVHDPVYFIFSNDIDWCKSNISWGNRKIVFREKKDQTNDFEELMLMASCQHAIIINSTYHWWGAQLISNPEKIVIAPKRWFADGKEIDIIPPTWVVI